MRSPSCATPSDSGSDFKPNPKPDLRCDEWFHTLCMEMNDEQVELVDMFICPRCEPCESSERNAFTLELGTNRINSNVYSHWGQDNVQARMPSSLLHACCSATAFAVLF